MTLRLSLQRHPDTSCPPLTGIEVELARVRPMKLALRYVLLGAAHNIRMKPPAGSSDPLWMHTCFEAFIRVAGEEEYLEINLAPTGDWTAWRFRQYRDGMEAVRGLEASVLGSSQRRKPMDRAERARLREAGFDTLERFEPSFYSLQMEVTLDPAMSLFLDRPWRLGLSAVIEENNGRISYWALAHPPGKPDFHHPDCFGLELPAAKPGPSPRT
ncbi:MAG TPA: DOMON-like domain-containing protein [Allosphingosinicella sp.]